VARQTRNGTVDQRNSVIEQSRAAPRRAAVDACVFLIPV
jgi:hypothetical protein